MPLWTRRCKNEERRSEKSEKDFDLEAQARLTVRRQLGNRQPATGNRQPATNHGQPAAGMLDGFLTVTFEFRVLS